MAKRKHDDTDTDQQQPPLKRLRGPDDLADRLKAKLQTEFNAPLLVTHREPSQLQVLTPEAAACKKARERTSKVEFDFGGPAARADSDATETKQKETVQHTRKMDFASEQEVKEFLRAAGAVVGLRAETALEAFTIPTSDLRVALHGQQGVRATRSIAAGTVLLCYSGLVYFDEADVCGKMLEEQVLRYTLETTVRSKASGSGGGMRRLVITAVPPVGSMAGLVNDPAVNPFANASDPYMKQVAPANVVVQQVMHWNWPFLFLVAARDIGAGQELLMKYDNDKGTGYWKPLLEQQARQEKHAEERQLLQDALEAVQELRKLKVDGSDSSVLHL